MRVALAEDSVLFREGLARLLSDDGHEVVVSIGDADSLVQQALLPKPNWSSPTSGCPPR